MKYRDFLTVNIAKLAQNKTLFARPISELKDYESVILWGDSGGSIAHRNIISINPAKIEQKSQLHVQIKPNRDFLLALLLSRFAIIENRVNDIILEKFSDEIKEFYELTQTIRIKATLEEIGSNLSQIGHILEEIVSSKCAIIVGSGVMRHRDSLDTLRAIETFALLANLISEEKIDVFYNSDFARADKDIGDFEFLDEIDIDSSDDEFYFIGCSDKISENSVYIHSDFAFFEGEMVEFYSDQKSIKLKVAIDDSLRRDCVRFSSDFDCSDIFEIVKYYGIDANIYKSYKLRMRNE